MTFVLVEYNPKIILRSNQVEFGGAAFDCSNCCGSDKCVCCNDLNSNSIACMKCSCQGKLSSCGSGGNCCYYQGPTVCTGRCFSNCAGSPGGDCGQNSLVIDKKTVARATVSCTQAVQYINDKSLIGQVINANAIYTQCNEVSQMKCCRGDFTIGATNCGPYWGPTNEGTCDTIMTNYCTNPVNAKDAQCACILSELPAPECTDKKCRNTNAMKLAKMVRNECIGNYMTCNMYFTIGATAKDNFIQNNTFQQTCTQNANSPQDSAAIDSVNNALTVTQWVVVAVAVLAGVSFVGLLGNFIHKKKVLKNASKGVPKNINK